MVFTCNLYLTEEDIRTAVAGSAYDVELPEVFDSNGDVCIRDLMVDGKKAAQFWKSTREYGLYGQVNDKVKYGLLNEGDYYWIGYGQPYQSTWFDKASIEFKDLKTRDDVLAYLAENGFVEVEETIYARGFRDKNNSSPMILPNNASFEYADIPHYSCKGAQSITLYRMHKLSETDQEIEYKSSHYSGAHLNLVNYVTFQFNTDGTIVSKEPTDYSKYDEHREGVYIPGFYTLKSYTKEFIIAGEQID